MRIDLHAAVLRDDLPAIYAFIARDNPAAAERVLEAVQSTFDQLVQQPESGVRYHARNPKLTDVRMLPVNDFANYLIFYRVEANAVRILYVVHGALHLPRLFRREVRR